MRPYLAVVKDSFREALASRVLWIMLILIGLFLAAIAPFGWKESLAYQVYPDEIRRVDEFVDYLSKPANQTIPSVKQVRTLLSDEVLKVSESRRSRFQQRYQLAEKLTEAIEEGTLEVDSWDVTFGDEGSALQAMGGARTVEQTQRLARLALGKAFTRYVKQAPDGTVAFQWGGMDLGLPALPKKAAREIVGIWINVIIQLIAGAAGVFVGVLVTASIIPNTFDAGSVYLLLSKPISRPLLYLAKFIGGMLLRTHQRKPVDFRSMVGRGGSF